MPGLVEEAAGDIVVKVDRLGFLESASCNITQIGPDPSQLLLKPHLTDLTRREFGPQLRNYIAMVLSGETRHRGDADWFEFPANLQNDIPECGGRVQRQWYALSLRAIADQSGVITGAVGLMRSADQLQASQSSARPGELVDPLTGLPNRHSFCSGLGRMITTGIQGVLAMFEIDHLRAVSMQFGQRAADEVIWAFSRFLTTMANPECELGQLDTARFCVVLPGYDPDKASDWARDVLDTLASLSLAQNSRKPRLTASAGLAPLGGNTDCMLRQCEVALVMARARGKMQVARCFPKPAAVSARGGDRGKKRGPGNAGSQIPIAL